jgi:Nucleotidyl transferase of unknown function (DUF2204)
MNEPRPLDDNGASAELYRTVLASLHDAGIAFVVGGTYAMERLAGVARLTKDLDLFVLADDWPAIEQTLQRSGVEAHIEFSHWLAKATRSPDQVDLIFAGGNGFVRVDADWISHGTPGVVLGFPVHICPAEEMIWSKAFVMERERFDGADVLHIIRRSGRDLDWHRLVRRFGDHGNVLLAHLLLFLFVYPDATDLVPDWLMDTLWARRAQQPFPADRVCRGTLLSRAQYLVDVHAWGYADARAEPHGRMTDDEIAGWTAAVEPAMVPSPI